MYRAVYRYQSIVNPGSPNVVLGIENSLITESLRNLIFQDTAQVLTCCLFPPSVYFPPLFISPLCLFPPSG